MRFLLIRHAHTRGNIERRYVCDPGEPLCARGEDAVRALASSGALPPVDVVYTGRALRCRRTAAVLFPNIEPQLCDMREIDFGAFAGSTADELSDDARYAAWLDTGCMGDIPGGDSVRAFKALCCAQFESIAARHASGTVALIVHGGNIMAILERFALPKQDFYAYHASNCGWYLCEYADGALRITHSGGGPQQH